MNEYVLDNIEEREGMMNVVRSRQRGGKDACNFKDYEVTINREALPKGVKLIEKI